MRRFEEKVVLITGGTKGLGKAMAKAFVEEGARVAVNGRSNQTVAGFEEEFQGKAVRAYTADITDYYGMEVAVKDIVEDWGKIDILINNAGIVSPLSPSEKVKKEDFDKAVDVNLKGTFYVTQIVGRKMIEAGSGRIISISSQVSLAGEKGFLPYAMSKAALHIMTRNLAFEWSKFGVTLCTVAPGFIAGGMNEGLIKREAFVNYLSGRTPIGRMGTVEEIVATILFLASPEARYINGETIVMDGGMTGYVQEPLIDVLMKPKG
jgi:NAD(P)-dependent dehydrogenase (short-subunit alcohol dehydrogenase family)